MKYTFDQNYIQDDFTGDFLTEIEVTARCKPFTGEGIAEHRIQISRDKTVRVWDGVAGHYTTCHSLSRAAQNRIIKAHIR